MGGLLGLLIGSFLNVVIYRLPIMLDREWRAQSWQLLWGSDRVGANRDQKPFNLLVPGSACPHCGVEIRAHQNIPVISYLLLKGACAACGAKISARYPAIEALTGILSAAVAWRFGFSIECAGALILTWSLITLTMIDFDTQLLPDSITLPLMWAGLLFSLATHADGSAIFTDPRASMIGAAAGYLSLWSIYQGFKLVTGKEGMGYGDFKLLAALGAWLGWQVLFLIVIVSAGVGLIAAVGMMVLRGHDRQIPIPFGPYLSIAGFIALMYGPELITAYLNLSGL
ncbi:MAG: prepilin peptidase [Gammaproteobacteria bacterium]|nr:MAG: prepilin peptidase [Gammaproteobacteria bacterium]